MADLVDDLGGCQVAPEPCCPRCAEQAREGAAGLRGDLPRPLLVEPPGHLPGPAPLLSPGAEEDLQFLQGHPLEIRSCVFHGIHHNPAGQRQGTGWGKNLRPTLFACRKSGPWGLALRNYITCSSPTLRKSNGFL